MSIIHPAIHLFLHLIIPGAVARMAVAKQWKSAWLIMILTMVVDLDHLLAHPIYDPNRCGIGFHPLHSYPAIVFYLLLAMVPKTRVVGFGLIIHMALDGMDCLWMILA
ncbi:DUF6122 family protein [Thermodesulfobacteriota bacterium]